MLVDYLRTLSSLDRSSPQFPDVLCRVLNESDFDEYTKDLGPDPLLKLIEYLDEVCPLNRSRLLPAKFILGPRWPGPNTSHL